MIPGRKCLNKDHYQSMQAARRAWIEKKKIYRSQDSANVGYDVEDMTEWTTDAQFKNLSYKDFTEQRELTGYLNGFFSKSSGEHLLLALYEHFALQGKDAASMLEVDSYTFKCRFVIEDNMQGLPRDEESDDPEPEAPEIQTEVTATIK